MSDEIKLFDDMSDYWANVWAATVGGASPDEAIRDGLSKWANAEYKKLRAQHAKQKRESRTPPTEKQRALTLSKYGLTVRDYDRMLEAQAQSCAICGIAYDPIVPLVVDHCHKTGRVRGLLCGPCNKGLGHYFDQPERLRRAADYLELAASRPGISS